jgi:hypothetical protein
VKVVDHEPQLWFLVEDEGVLLFDVGCEFNCVGYSVLIALDQSETEQYQIRGHAYLSQLADAINYSVPGAKVSSSPYKTRNIQSSKGEAVSKAIEAWKKSIRSL